MRQLSRRALLAVTLATVASVPGGGFQARAQMPGNPAHSVVPAPALSQAQVRRVLTSLSIDLLLAREYAEATGDGGDWKTAGVPGIVLARYFEKKTEAGRLTLELVAARAAAGGYDFHLYGRLEGESGSGPNPEVPDISASLTQKVTTMPPDAGGAGGAGAMGGGMPPGGMPLGAFPPGGAPGAPGAPAAPGTPPQVEALTEKYGALGHILYSLSFVQADRAIGHLKALGYSTVEFVGTPGESAYQKVYSPSASGAGRELPLVVKLIDAPKTSLMDADPAKSATGPGGMPMMAAPSFPSAERKAVPDIGGTYLHTSTSGEPQERLLILYDKADPGGMELLLDVLREQIDVPARQVVISALVLEVNTDKARELGIEYFGGDGRNTFSFQVDPTNGAQLPLSYTYDKNAITKPFDLTIKVRALIESGEAEVLSNPSVLVLDGRQARIQVGQQVPVVNSTSTAAGITSSVEYFPVGIVLNLRPRINERGDEVTMQVETIVSAVASSAPSTSSVFYAPTVDNRQVQTFVRVADNTPFIIGGLISSSTSNSQAGIPWLSKIPILGALFRSENQSATKREVIVVLTPHVVPANDKAFSYVIPKDSDSFDSFGHQLFRNAYRIRSTDIFDLQFVHESDILKGLVARVRARSELDPAIKRRQPFASLLAGDAPGEEILVHRMLWEIVRRSGYGGKIDPKQVLVFRPSATDPSSTDFELSFLDAQLAGRTPDRNALLISFNASQRGTPEHPFAQPKALISYDRIAQADYQKRLVEANRGKPDGTRDAYTIILSDDYTGTSHPLDTLRNVLVLKRLLALNAAIPKTIKTFTVGRQVIFPTENDIARSLHVVDLETARLFYEITEYYRAFEEEFNRSTRAALEEMAAK